MTNAQKKIPITPLLRLWYSFKSLRLPWRNKYLVGMDLHGNTYWEFSPPGAAAHDRRRRIVQYPDQVHHGDVTISPAWHQWLRNTRVEPPSIEEQRADIARQERMKVLAAEADARWEAKPRVMDAPTPKQEIVGGTKGAGLAGDVKGMEGEGKGTVSREETWERMKRQAESQGAKKVDDPWKRARGGLSEEWQPEGWQPQAKKSS